MTCIVLCPLLFIMINVPIDCKYFEKWLTLHYGSYCLHCLLYIFIANIPIYPRIMCIVPCSNLFILINMHIYWKYFHFSKKWLVLYYVSYCLHCLLHIFVANIPVSPRMVCSVAYFNLFILIDVHIYWKYFHFSKNGLYCTVFHTVCIACCAYLLQIFPFPQEWFVLYYVSTFLYW